jgi:UDP-N-acetylglucosamine 2-epimerase (non-hydrolysing)
MRTILVAFGTRPEAIKLAPVVRALAELPGVRVRVANVGQHAEMLDETIAAFGIETDHRLEVIREEQTLEALTARALKGIGEVIRADAPDMVVVQGDTTTTFVSALAAFYARVPVAHVEAGLRTGIPDLPFPEEMNRRLTSAITTLHFPPTEDAAVNLRHEGIEPKRVVTTGNTVLDALRWMLERGDPPPEDLQPVLSDPRRTIVVTAHRRESWGVPMQEIGSAIAELAGSDDGLLVVFPIHPNPAVRRAIGPKVKGLDNIIIREPLPYPAFVHLMDAAHILLTDSGGIQEEAAALRKPVLVMREVTERAEGIATGTAELIGRDSHDIVKAVRRLLDDDELYAQRAGAENPYGDGHAAERIARAIGSFLSGGP